MNLSSHKSQPLKHVIDELHFLGSYEDSVFTLVEHFGGGTCNDLEHCVVASKASHYFTKFLRQSRLPV